MRRIKFEIKKPGPVSIRVFDIIGNQISLFVNNYDFPGYYDVNINDEHLIPGRYYYKIYNSADAVITDKNRDENKDLLFSGSFIVGSSSKVTYYENINL